MRLFFRTIAVSGLTLIVSLASAAEVRVLSNRIDADRREGHRH